MKQVSLALIIVTSLTLHGCSGNTTSPEDNKATIQAAVNATLAAQPASTSTPIPTDTPPPTETSTALPTNTPMPTDTPTISPTETPTDEPTETPTPAPANTPIPTATPTDVSSTPITAQNVIDKFNTAGLGVTDVRQEARAPDSPLPNSFQERLAFNIPEVAPNGGQVFVCDTKQNCDAIYAYFDVLKGLAGPYLYQSPNGKVVIQLNKGLKPETGSKFQEVINSLP